MKFGLTDEQYEYIQKVVVAPLQKRNLEVWCFGSRARGDFQKFSDLDLLIEGQCDDLQRIVSQIKETLETSNFHYKVDIIIEEELAESYAESVARDKIIINKESK